MRKRALWSSVIGVLLLLNVAQIQAQRGDYDFNDAHVHLTNNVQEGPSARDFLMMGNHAGRAALFGIPLQQQWSYRVDGDRERPITFTRMLRCTTTRSPMLG